MLPTEKAKWQAVSQVVTGPQISVKIREREIEICYNA